MKQQYTRQPRPPKTILSNDASERALLGTLIREPELVLQMNGAFSPDLFSVPINKNIATAIRSLADTGRDIRIPSIIGRMPPASEEETPLSPQGYMNVIMREAVDPGVVGEYLAELGQLSMRRMLKDSGQKLAADIQLDDGRTPEEVLEQFIVEARGRTVTEAEHIFDMGTAIVRAKEAFLDRRSGKVKGLPWFMPGLNDMLGEMDRGDLVGGLCNPKMGKTSIACQQARFAASRGPVIFFSNEMNVVKLTNRFIAQEAKLDEADIAKGRLSDADFTRYEEAAEVIAALPLRIVDTKGVKVSQMRAKAVAYANEEGRLELIVCDHLKWVRPEKFSTNSMDKFEQILPDAKELADHLKTPLFMLMQRTRSSIARENPRPTANDGYGGGATIENVDSMMGIWRPEVHYKDHEPPKHVVHPKWVKSDGTPWTDWKKLYDESIGKAELLTLARRVGTGGSYHCRFNGPCVSFEPERPEPVPERFNEQAEMPMDDKRF